jgi:hypothetical protein
MNERDPYAMNVACPDSCGGWIAIASDLTAFFTHISGCKDTDQLLSDETLHTMSAPTAANPRYAKGLFVDPQKVYLLILKTTGGMPEYCLGSLPMRFDASSFANDPEPT